MDAHLQPVRERTIHAGFAVVELCSLSCEQGLDVGFGCGGSWGVGSLSLSPSLLRLFRSHPPPLSLSGPHSLSTRLTCSLCPPHTQPHSYAIFDWDNLFASLLAGLENKGVAYSNLFQVVKTKTAAGFVPNFSAGGASSQDRTEPPVGAKVVLELFKKYGDKWMVEVVFDDLLDWNSWFLANRVLKPAGLIALGSFNTEAAAQGQGQGGSNNMQDVGG